MLKQCSRRFWPRMQLFPDLVGPAVQNRLKLRHFATGTRTKRARQLMKEKIRENYVNLYVNLRPQVHLDKRASWSNKVNCEAVVWN